MASSTACCSASRSGRPAGLIQTLDVDGADHCCSTRTRSALIEQASILGPEGRRRGAAGGRCHDHRRRALATRQLRRSRQSAARLARARGRAEDRIPDSSLARGSLRPTIGATSVHVRRSRRRARQCRRGRAPDARPRPQEDRAACAVGCRPPRSSAEPQTASDSVRPSRIRTESARSDASSRRALTVREATPTP